MSRSRRSSDKPTQSERGPGSAKPTPRREEDIATATLGATDATPSAGFPEAWDRYDHVAFLGEGGMGQVFKAWDPRLKRNVALKFLARQRPRDIERFQAEAQSQARVDHEHVCKVYEVGDADGRPYIAMQYIDGKTLGKAVAEMSLEDQVYVVRKVAEAVHAAHAQGLIHRDLKPANVIVERTDKGFRPTVLDFGIARELGSAPEHEIAGTPAYMSPEQQRGEIGDRRVDVWGLGTVLHTLLASGPPGSMPLPSSVPPDLRAITHKCLQAAPDRRYPSAAAVAEELRRYADGEPISAHPPSLLYRAGKRLRKHKALAAVAVIAVVALGILGAFTLHERRVSEQRVALAQRFGQKVARLEMHMRQAYGAPLHDVRRERKLVLAQMTAIDGEARSLGDSAIGPAAYAIGRAQLSLHDWDAARGRLEEAWREGYRTPDTSYALGLALGKQYQRALAETRRLDDPAQRERVRAELRRTLRDPALEQLRAARNADLEAPAYVEGLIAFYEGDRALALGKAEAAFETAPWLYEAKALAGDVYTAEASERLLHGDYDGARTDLARGSEAYAAAEALAPSDSALLELECEQRGVGLSIDTATGRATADQIDQAVEPCDRSHVADPESTGPLVRAARILGTGASFLWTSRGIAPDPLLDRAVVHADEALAAQPALAQAWYARARCFVFRARAEKERGKDPRASLGTATDNFEKALALDPKLAAAYADECNSYQTLANWEADNEQDPLPSLSRAIAVGERGVLADPRDIHAHRSLGTAWLWRGMWESDHNVDPAASFEHASKAYASVLAINPKDAATANNDAMVRETLGAWRLDHSVPEGEADLDRADAEYLEALRIGGEDSDTLVNLGHIAWERALYYLRIGRDVQPTIDAGLAYLARAHKRNANEINVYFNTIQLNMILAEALLNAGASPTTALTSVQAAIDEHRRHKPGDHDVDAIEADAHILAARVARDPSSEFALAERALARARADGEPTMYLHAAEGRLNRYRAEWLIAAGRPATADLTAGLAAAEKLDAMDPGAPDTRILRGALVLLQARVAKDPAVRREAAARARGDFTAAIHQNRFFEREATPLIAEADKL